MVYRQKIKPKQKGKCFFFFDGFSCYGNVTINYIFTIIKGKPNKSQSQKYIHQKFLLMYSHFVINISDWF